MTGGKVKDFILNLLFPKECLGCQREGIWLCESCFKSLDFLFTNYLKSPSRFLDKIFAAGSYDNSLLKSAIFCLKYHYVQELAVDLSRYLINYLKKVPEYPFNNFVLIPVPLHSKRLRERGFNQAGLLAQEASPFLKLPLGLDFLIRRRYTKPQVDLKGEARVKNVADAFYCLKPEAVKGKKIILVDDVLTTGSTLSECARVLKESGAKEVYGLALAKG